MTSSFIPRVQATILQDFILNGNFSINTCANYYGMCWWTQSQHTQTRLYGWNITPSIEMGYGPMYNPAISDKQVVSLNSY